MNKEELAPGIIVYRDALENHETFVKEFEEAMNSGTPGFEWRPPYVLKDGKNVTDHTSRDLLTFGVDYEAGSELKNFHESPIDAFNNLLSFRFRQGFLKYEQDYRNHFRFETVWHDMFNILKYGEGHFFVNHVDDNQVYLRRMSVIWYANDDYEGGEITFNRFGLKYKPKANDLLIFPSTYVYDHSVVPVTKGFRYAVVSWLH